MALNLVYIAIAFVLVFGWFEWARQPQRRDACSLLALVGYVLGTVSLLMVVASVVYAQRVGGFAFGDPLWLRIIRLGSAISCGGLMFAVLGVWRRSALRWYALGFSLGTLFFWLGAAVGE